MLGVSTLWRRASHGNRESGLSCRGGIDWALEGHSMLSVDVPVARSNACIGTLLHSFWRGVGIGILSSYLLLISFWLSCLHSEWCKAPIRLLHTITYSPSGKKSYQFKMLSEGVSLLGTPNLDNFQ